jgi:uncharacterized protein YjbI with pentapeptide repeats
MGIRRSSRSFAGALFGAATLAFGLMMPAIATYAADFSAGQVTQALFKAKPGDTPDLSFKDLRELDLAGVNFKGANLTGSNLYGANLSGANLTGTSLKGGSLNRANVAQADFSGANLEDVSLLRLTIFTTLERDPREAPRFAKANLRNAKLSGWMDGTDFSGADLSGALFGQQDAHNEGLLASRVRLIGANFSGANLTGADLNGSQLVYARFAGAKLAGTNLRDTDLSSADFSDADVTGMDVTGANLEHANFQGAIGIGALKGLAQAQNAGHVATP